MTPRISGSLFAFACLVLGSVFAWAQASPPRGVPYQGRLEMGGAAVNGSHDLSFQFYDAASGGNALGASIDRTVAVQGGAFATVLSPVPDEIFAGENVWLSITVDGTTLMGRQQMLSVPFALGSVATEEMVLSGGLQVGSGLNGQNGVAGAINQLSVINIPLGDESAGGLVIYDAQNASQIARVIYDSNSGALRVENAGSEIVINGSGVVTIDAPRLSVTSTVRLANFESDGCPPQMERVGFYCIDMSVNAAASINDAILGCHNEGKMLCPVQALMQCDSIEPRGGGVANSCAEATDRTASDSYRISTSTIGGFDSANIYGESAYSNFVCYDPTNQEAQNSYDGCTDDQVEQYFCCTMASPTAVGGY